VYVTSTGQLGVLASSQRYKTDITPIGAAAEKLAALRPVSFHLKSDPHGTLQYGLIAEEVDQVYPELVIRDEAGKIQGVRYDELAPMLVSEMQQQRRVNAGQAAQIGELQQQLALKQQQLDAQAARLGNIQQQLVEMQAGLLKLQSKEQMVAQR
jgi:hypothetical protein